MTSSCPHVGERRRTLTSWYSSVVQRLVFPSQPHYAKNKMSRAIRCSVCPASERLRVQPLLCCCTECCTFACLEHIRPHMRDDKHYLALSLETGYLYCLCCADFVYDRLLEMVRMNAQNAYRSVCRLGASKKISWNPSDEDVRVCSQQQTYTHNGMRGMVNLGNTCFMNSIVQALMHTPTLRDYFLSDQHSAHCHLEQCLMCEIGKTFQEFYRGPISDAFVPSAMLQMVWSHSHLAGYHQQDAHEFFITALDMLHKHSQPPFSEKTIRKQDCKCIIDRIFTGQLESVLGCRRCPETSDKLEPFWDVSLEVPGEGSVNLEDCLQMYIRQEELPRDALIECGGCGGRGAATKQLLFFRTPVVLAIHLKRFEHALSTAGKKVSTQVRFPSQLDMTPFLSEFKKDSWKFDEKNNSLGMLNRKAHNYSLYAVVNHVGTLDSGHYTCFVRHRGLNSWYKCDDHLVFPVSEADVLASEAYLLFYTASTLKFQ